MNTISWALYLINVMGKISVTFAIILLLGCLAGVVIGAYYIVEVSDSPKDSKLEKDFYRIIKWYAAVMLTSGVLHIVIPSTNTMYAILASEVGQEIGKHERVQGVASEAMLALEQWIKKQREQ